MWYLFDLGQYPQGARYDYDLDDVDYEEVDYEEVTDEDEAFDLD